VLAPPGATATALAVCERLRTRSRWRSSAALAPVAGGGRATGQARFAHELIREACAAQCAPETARRLHRRIADTVAGTAAEAHHRLAGEEATPTSRACFLREGRRFEDKRALVEALRYAEAALAVAAFAPGDEDDLPLRVATLRARTGRHEAAAALLLQHLDRTEELLRARYLHCLAYTYWLQGRRDESLLHLRRAVEAYRAHGDTEARSLVDGYSPYIVDLIEVLLTTGDAAAAGAECDRALKDMVGRRWRIGRLYAARGARATQCRHLRHGEATLPRRDRSVETTSGAGSSSARPTTNSASARTTVAISTRPNVSSA
jgi:tetratricopeptide (TPR) repeat protein